MNISEASAQLRELSEDYSNQRVTCEEYRSKRKSLLDDIDKVFNGQSVSVPYEKEEYIEPIEIPDATDEIFTDTANRITEDPNDETQ